MIYARFRKAVKGGYAAAAGVKSAAKVVKRYNRYRKGMRSYKPSAGFVRAVKTVVETKLETPQHKIFTDSTASLLANNIYSLNLLGNIAQGTAYNNRIGDILHFDAIKLKIRLDYTANGVTGTGVGGVSNPVYYRIMLIRSKLNKQGATDTITAGNFSATDLFINPIATTAVSMLEDPKLINVVWQTTGSFGPSSVNSGSLNTPSRFIDQTVRVNKQFTYETATNYAKNYNYYLLATAYSNSAVTNSTNLASMVVNADLIFKNCK